MGTHPSQNRKAVITASWRHPTAPHLNTSLTIQPSLTHPWQTWVWRRNYLLIACSRPHMHPTQTARTTLIAIKTTKTKTNTNINSSNNVTNRMVSGHRASAVQVLPLTASTNQSRHQTLQQLGLTDGMQQAQLMATHQGPPT